MGFRHVVLLKFATTAAATQRQAVLEALAMLPSQIPVIK